MTQTALLPDRTVLQVTGADRVSFLNGLVSNDVALAGPGRAVWAALLTPQGKYLADFFIFADSERLLLDCAASQAGLVAARLMRFRLRADVAVAPEVLQVYASWPGCDLTGIMAPDPRLPDAGWRTLAAPGLPVTASHADWTAHRIVLGLPDGPADMEPEKSILLEAGFDELSGVSWTKGCYMGQELTARTRYRGLLKRRLLPVTAQTALPPPGTEIHAADRAAGVLRSVHGSIGLALLRLDSLDAALAADGVALSVQIPAWAKLPGAEAEPITVPDATGADA